MGHGVEWYRDRHPILDLRPVPSLRQHLHAGDLSNCCTGHLVRHILVHHNLEVCVFYCQDPSVRVGRDDQYGWQVERPLLPRNYLRNCRSSRIQQRQNLSNRNLIRVRLELVYRNRNRPLVQIQKLLRIRNRFHRRNHSHRRSHIQRWTVALRGDLQDGGVGV